MFVEWPADYKSQDSWKNNRIYTPRLDIAVGPFNTDANIDVNKQKIEQKYEENMSFISNLQARKSPPTSSAGPNSNPRCFLAVEIENTGTRKHRLGSILNAAALGKVGIVVGWNREVTKSLTRIDDYLTYLYTVGKLVTRPPRPIIIDKSSFWDALQEI